MNRDQKIIRTSWIGIITNILLATFKAIVGLVTNSIAIVLDAVNNLSDALSSVITIVGTKLSSRSPDKTHPFGYGRVEYLTTMSIGLLILYAGITSFSESFQRILSPTTPTYTTTSIVLVLVAVFVKIALGSYFKKVGKEVQSDSLIGSGQDALMDSILSFSTVVAAVIFLLFHVSLEAYLGIVIALFIIKAGVDLLKDVVSQLLGQRVDSGLAKQIKEAVLSVDGVRGAYDLTISDYGPNRLIGSVHIEVDDTLKAEEIDALSRKIQHKVITETGVALTAVGIYSKNTQNQNALQAEKEIRDIVFDNPHVLQMHGFYYNKETRLIRFDVIIDYEVKDRAALQKELISKIQPLFPDFDIQIVFDLDISD